MRVRETMTTPAYCVRDTDAIPHVAAELIGRGQAKVPVVDRRGRLRGMLGEASLSTGARTAGEAMQPETLTLSPSMDAAEAARRMLQSGESCAPVIDRDRVVGTLDVHSVLRALGRQANEVLRHAPQGPLARPSWDR